MSSNYYFISFCWIGYADDGESLAKEVIEWKKQKDAFFGASNEPHYDRRTKSVNIRIGDTVRHSKLSYRAVVVGTLLIEFTF